MTSLPNPNFSIDRLRHMAAGDEVVGPHIVDLIALLGQSDEEVRAWVSDVLQTVEQAPPEIAQALVGFCESKHPPVAAWACKLIATLGPAATPLQHAIVKVLDQHAELTVRQQAAQSLSQVPGLSEATIAALKRAAESSDPRLRRLATQTLESAEREN
jgi:HEAT repeat protein